MYGKWEIRKFHLPSIPLSNYRSNRGRRRVISIRFLRFCRNSKKTRKRRWKARGTIELVMQARYRCIKICLGAARFHPSEFEIIISCEDAVPCLPRSERILNFQFDEKISSLKCYFWRSGRRRNLKFKSNVYFEG